MVQPSRITINPLSPKLMALSPCEKSTANEYMLTNNALNKRSCKKDYEITSKFKIDS